MFKLMGKFCFSWKCVHGERISEDGGAILAMNHQSYLDPPLAGICCRKEVFFLARNTLLDWPIMGWVFPRWNVIPVDQSGGDMKALKIIIRLLKEGKRTIVFPEGSRTFDGNLQPAQPGLGLIVAKTLVPVIPMRIFGAYDAFPRGAKWPKFRPITIVVGEPMHFTADDVKAGGKQVYQQISEQVLKTISELSLPPELAASRHQPNSATTKNSF